MFNVSLFLNVCPKTTCECLVYFPGLIRVLQLYRSTFWAVRILNFYLKSSAGFERSCSTGHLKTKTSFCQEIPWHIYSLYSPFPVATLWSKFCIFWQKTCLMTSTALAHTAVSKLLFKSILLKNPFLHLCYITWCKSWHISFKNCRTVLCMQLLITV